MNIRSRKTRFSIIIFCVIITLAFLPSIALTEDYAIYTYDESKVPDIGDYQGMMQDSHGFIWIWGTEGAAYYDGNEFHYFSENNGLASNFCYNIKELSDGKIYICNYRGLNTYDFSTKTLERHPVDIISAFRDIFEGKDFLFIAGDAEIYAVRGKAFYRVPIIDHRKDKIVFSLINSVTDVGDNKFWASTEYAGVIEYDTDYINDYLKFKDENIQRELEEIGNGAFEKKYPEYIEQPENYVIDTDEKRLSYILKFQRAIALPPIEVDRFPIYNAIQNYKGSPYVFALGGIFEIVDGGFIDKNPSTLSTKIKSVYNGGLDNFGRLYFQTNLGLHLVTGNDTLLFSNSNGLPGSKVQAFLADRDNNLWFAQSAGELSKIVSQEISIFSLHDYPFIAEIIKAIPSPNGGLMLGGPNGFSLLTDDTLEARLELSEEVYDFIYDALGNMIILTSNSIAHVDLKNRAGSTLKYFRYATEGEILTTKTTDDLVWITIAGELFKWDGINLEAQKGLEFETIYPISLTAGPDGCIFIGTWNGIARFKDGNETFFHREWTLKGDVYSVNLPEDINNVEKFLTNHPDGYFIRDVAAVCGEVGLDGATWFGTFKSGIVRIEGDLIQRWDTRHGMPDNSIKSVYKHTDGILYFVGPSGIVKVDENGPEPIEINVPENVLLENILIDEKDRIYFASNQGLWILDDEMQFVLDRGFGLTESWINFVTKSENGNIVVTQPNNVFTFNPDSLINTLKQSKMVPLITSFKTGNLSLPVSDEMNLPKGYRNFDITIALPEYLNESRHEYSWMLEGLDEEFTPSSQKMDISYERVPFGRYKLRVKAFDSIGNEYKIQTPITIEIPPYYWETTFFRITMILGISCLIVLFYWIRIKSIRQRNILLEEMVANRTRELEKALIELEKSKELEVETEKLRSAQKLASSIAHEFNNPMAVIKGVLDINEEKSTVTLNEISGKHIEMIHRNLGRMADLIIKLLNITKLKEIEYTRDTTIYDLHSSDSSTTTEDNNSNTSDE